ncbi:Yae1p SCDLUD_000419 [Saccharomycodes ludwigii]|uniref:Yae1p n=1 Tax=Saccharomycodes ludwigii TaxID=36035 RepID=UPI001E87670F|nr:hypothetical protein SCDLUD_000419 [Saccharomycodes ludwigii]KAH3902827.1 hypothetical protein SCDLUD_000419 [Saccharomycodes ludwigii]
MDINNDVNEIWDDANHNNDQSFEKNPDLINLQEKHRKRGYLDGIVSAKEEKLQDGFDSAYPVGAALGKEVGEIIGTLQFLTNLYGEKDPNLQSDFKLCIKECYIGKILSNANFNHEYELQNKIIIDKWQKVGKDYLEKYINK